MKIFFFLLALSFSLGSPLPSRAQNSNDSNRSSLYSGSERLVVMQQGLYGTVDLTPLVSVMSGALLVGGGVIVLGNLIFLAPKDDKSWGKVGIVGGMIVMTGASLILLGIADSTSQAAPTIITLSLSALGVGVLSTVLGFINDGRASSVRRKRWREEQIQRRRDRPSVKSTFMTLGAFQ